MEIGTILGLVLIVGTAGIGLALLGKYSGVTDILGVLGSFIGIIVSFFTDLVRKAPRWVNLVIFLTIGILIIGFAADWFVSSNRACVDGDLYVVDFLPGLFLKFGTVEDTVTLLDRESDEELAARIQSNLIENEDDDFAGYFEGTSGTFSTGSSLASASPNEGLPFYAKERFLSAKFVLDSYGTILAEGSALLKYENAVGGEFFYSNEVGMDEDYIFVPADFLPYSAEDVLFGEDRIFAVAAGIYPVVVCQDNEFTLGDLFGEEHGVCYLQEGLNCKSRSHDEVAQWFYSLSAYEVDGERVGRLNVNWCETSGFFGDCTSGNELDKCSQGYPLQGNAGRFRGTYVLPAIYTSTPSKSDELIVTSNKGGFVEGKYVPLREFAKIDTFDFGQISGRSAYLDDVGAKGPIPQGKCVDVVETRDGFNLNETRGCVLTHKCSNEGDSVIPLIWGFAIFEIENLIFLMVLIGAIYLLKWLI